MTTHPGNARTFVGTTGGEALRIVASQAAVVLALGLATLLLAAIDAPDTWADSAVSLSAGAGVSALANGLLYCVVAPWRRQRAAEVMARTAIGTAVKFAATVLGFAVVLSRWDVFFPLVLAGWLLSWSCYIWVPLAAATGRADDGPTSD